jgi:hypothetical protein
MCPAAPSAIRQGARAYFNPERAQRCTCEVHGKQLAVIIETSMKKTTPVTLHKLHQQRVHCTTLITTQMPE